MNQLEKRIVGYPFWLSRQVSTVCMKARCTVNNFSYMCCMFINSTWAVTHRMQVWTPRFRRPSETLITNGHRCINHRLPRPFPLARARLAASARTQATPTHDPAACPAAASATYVP